MISIFQAIVIGLFQGLTELFPISSLGHTVIVPSVLGWHIHQEDSYFLTFLVATHLATALVLLAFFWKDWVRIVKGLWRSLKARQVEPADTDAKLGWLLVIGTVPAGLLGIALQKKLQSAFASPRTAALFLIVNGLILYGAEKLRRRAARPRTRGITAEESTNRLLTRLRYRQALGIGAAQAAALIPGISRSGSAMAGGLLAGLDHESAARFSFLLATPVIAAAAILKLPHLFSHSVAPLRTAILCGALAAGLMAYLSVRFLVKYFQTRTLTPFAVYCVIAGIVVSLYLA